jgi:hypothetical protein
MRSRSLQRIALLAGMLAGPFVHADILVGGFDGNDTNAARPVIRYADTGNAAPLSSFYTDFVGERLQTPFSLAYEPGEGVVYVSDFYGQARVAVRHRQGRVQAVIHSKSPARYVAEGGYNGYPAHVLALPRLANGIRCRRVRSAARTCWSNFQRQLRTDRLLRRSRGDHVDRRAFAL